jgi:hypothetical protein
VAQVGFIKTPDPPASISEHWDYRPETPHPALKECHNAHAEKVVKLNEMF